MFRLLTSFFITATLLASQSYAYDCFASCNNKSVPEIRYDSEGFEIIGSGTQSSNKKDCHKSSDSKKDDCHQTSCMDASSQILNTPVADLRLEVFSVLEDLQTKHFLALILSAQNNLDTEFISLGKVSSRNSAELSVPSIRLHLKLQRLLI